MVGIVLRTGVARKAGRGVGSPSQSRAKGGRTSGHVRLNVALMLRPAVNLGNMGGVACELSKPLARLCAVRQWVHASPRRPAEQERRPRRAVRAGPAAQPPPADPDRLAELSKRWNLGGPVDRLTQALAKPVTS